MYDDEPDPHGTLKTVLAVAIVLGLFFGTLSFGWR